MKFVLSPLGCRLPFSIRTTLLRLPWLSRNAATGAPAAGQISPKSSSSRWQCSSFISHLPMWQGPGANFWSVHKMTSRLARTKSCWTSHFSLHNTYKLI